MNKIKYLLLSLVCISQLNAQQKQKKNSQESKYKGAVNIVVDINKLKDKKGKFYLESKSFFDSTIIVNGKLSFKENIQEPLVGKLFFIPASDTSGDLFPSIRNRYEFYLTPGTIHLLVNDAIAKTIVLKESTVQTEYRTMRTIEREYIRKNLSPLYHAYKAANKSGDKKLADSISTQFDFFQDSLNNKIIQPFIIANAKSSPVALTYLQSLAEDNFSYKKIQPLFVQLNPEYKSFPTGKALEKRLHFAFLTGIGQPAIDFTQNDTAGQPVKLSDFRGKYVLIDFWASWCGPCRAENPNILAAYNKYKDKNFTIIAVSLDQNKDKWLKAIHDDKLVWTQVSDLKSWGNEVGQLYGVDAVPQNFLIDPSGKIIAKNVRGEKLENELAALLHNSGN